MSLSFHSASREPIGPLAGAVQFRRLVHYLGSAYSVMKDPIQVGCHVQLGWIYVSTKPLALE